MRLVYGVGINDKKGFAKTKEYNLWVNMLARCYSERFHKHQPTYKDCTVSENFKSFSYFYDWCQNQIGFGLNGYQLDKDLLIKNNKHYSEDLCVFVPVEINNIIEKRDKMRGKYPIGVSFNKTANKFGSVFSSNGKQVYLGLFTSPIDAFLAYKFEKEKYIKIVADKYKVHIDKRSYDALLSYRVEMSD